MVKLSNFIDHCTFLPAKKDHLTLTCCNLIFSPVLGVHQPDKLVYSAFWQLIYFGGKVSNLYACGT